MSKFTPGPLYASGNGVHTRRGTVGLCTAIAYDPDDQSHLTDVARANAVLYSAAPDLLAACEAVWAAWRNDPNVNEPEWDGYTTIQQVRLAIAKAHGEETAKAG